MEKLEQSMDFIAGRKEGRNEALQILIGEDAETFGDDDYIVSRPLADTGDWTIEWNYQKLAELFEIQSHESILDRVDGAYWGVASESMEKEWLVQRYAKILAWYAAPHRPEDYLNDDGALARKILDHSAPENRGDELALRGLSNEPVLFRDKYEIFFCDLCNTFALKCPVEGCQGTTCNAGGCEKCSSDSDYYAFSYEGKARVTQYLNAKEHAIYQKIFLLKRYIGESLKAGFTEINWKYLQEKGKLCDLAEELFAKEIEESLQKV